jgi:[ribosomal protein S5]-alanine N-acetyltransferase
MISHTIELVPATIEFKPIIKNLARFYVYELTRYSEEDIPEDGLYEAYDASFNFDKYWEEAGYFPFIIRVDKKLAGFIFVNNEGSSSEVDWYLAEFYVLSKFQNKGIGRQVALQLLSQFTGTWEVTEMPKNLPAIRFWRSIIQQFTKGKYTEIKSPNPHEMICQRFISSQ